MKLRLLHISLSLSLCILLTSTSLIAQDQLLDELQKTKAIITFHETEYDWGEIKAGEKALNVFTFTNTGEVPLILSNAKGSCGCTVPNWPKEPIAPGESGEIVVVFDSKGKKNKQHKRVTITANTDPAQTFVSMKGNVIPAESVSDTAIEPSENEASVKEDQSEKLDLNSIVLFPNPTTDELRIELKALIGKSATIGVFSDRGQRLKTNVIDEISGEPMAIDVSQFASGTYLVSIVVNDSERITKTFSVIR